MERVNRIIAHPMWKRGLEQTAEAEKDRIFCGHDIDHFLHVARLAYIENLENGLGIGKELIYAAALLHDIGRGLAAATGMPHEDAGCAIAAGVLRDCGFTLEEQGMIIDAIALHRDKETVERSDLAGLLYRADKGSRACFCCEACEMCSWSEEKKNKEIKG